MSDSTAAMQRIGSGAGRVARAWRSLTQERRLAAIASIGLLLCLFLPWYQETVITGNRGSTVVSTGITLTGWDSFSFAEALVLLIAVGVLVLLFVRSEGRALPLPEYDGTGILSAGVFAALLIVLRIFDKQGTSGHGQYATASGIEWGIIFALVAAVLLAYSGSRIQAARQPGPPLPGGSAAGAPTGPRTPPQRPQSAGRERPTSPATRASGPRAPGPEPADPASTRVSAPRRPASLFGPPVSPEDPPTMRLETREHQAEPPGSDPTLPLDGQS